MNNLIEKLKTDKDFRYDFIIGAWSAVIVVFIIIALVVGVRFASKKINSDDNSNAAPTETAVPSPEATLEPTAQPSPTADILEGDDWYDETDIGTDDSDDDTLYTTDNVNARADSSTDSQSYGTIPAGTGVQVIERLSNGWTKIKYNDKEAYVKSEYLTARAASTRTPMDYYSSNEPSSSSTARPTITAASKATKAPKATKKPKKTKKPKATKAPKEDNEEDKSSVTQSTHVPEATTAPEVQHPAKATEKPAEATHAPVQEPSTQEPQPTAASEPSDAIE